MIRADCQREEFLVTDPVDVSKLDAPTLASHLAKPDGATGIAVSAGLNKTNEGPYRVARAKLALAAADNLLEIGFGNGHEIAALLAAAADITYTGIDISETMVAEAKRRNAVAVEAGVVTLLHAASDKLPLAAAVFDKALALNTIYFWRDPAVDLGEIRRVLCPGGRLVLGAIAPWSTSRPVFRHGFTFYSPEQLTALLQAAGFADVAIETLVDIYITSEGEHLPRDYFIVSAT